MTGSFGPPKGPSRDALWFLFGALVVVGAFALGLYAMTPAENREALLRWLAQGFPMLVFGAPALLAWLSGQRAADNTEALRHQVQQVSDQTNGNMAALIDKVGDQQPHKE